MASCFEVAMALMEADYIKGEDLEPVTTVLVETLLATGAIKERSRAVEDKSVDEEMFTTAQYMAAADEAMGEFEDQIQQAEMMLEAKERQISHEEVIMEADALISENARLATISLLDKGMIDSDKSSQVSRLITQAWASKEG